MCCQILQIPAGIGTVARDLAAEQTEGAPARVLRPARARPVRCAWPAVYGCVRLGAFRSSARRGGTKPGHSSTRAVPSPGSGERAAPRAAPPPLPLPPPRRHRSPRTLRSSSLRPRSPLLTPWLPPCSPSPAVHPLPHGQEHDRPADDAGLRAPLAADADPPRGDPQAPGESRAAAVPPPSRPSGTHRPSFCRRRRLNWAPTPAPSPPARRRSWRS